MNPAIAGGWMDWKSGLERAARLGYVCKGAVYVIIGVLTAATLTGRGEVADRQDAFRFILHRPFGRISLLVVGIGLAGYALWRVISGLTDSERRGHDAKGLAIRAGSAIRGVFYGVVAFELFRRVLQHQGAGKDSDAQARHWAARGMDVPFGRWLVAMVGLSVIGYGCWQLYVAVSGKLSKQIRTGAIPPSLLVISRLGIGGRAIVFGVIGKSLVSAALHHAPNRARGTSGAMRTLAGQPFGAFLLAAAGLALLAYGVYAFLNARYRDIEAT